jgi:flagellar capping protein FliD
MGSSITTLGALGQVGRLAGVLRPTITNRIARHERVDMHTRMLRSLATGSTSRGVSPLSDLAQQIADAQLAAARLSSERPGNAFDDRALVSANEAIVTGSATNGADFARFTVQVNALASTQLNLGTKMESSGATPIAPGTNTFSITTDDVTHLIHVPVDSNGTNRETLSGIARQINSADIGVTARVLEDGSSVQLELRADVGGAEGAFEIVDVTGNTISAIGARQVAVTASDAEVVVDGLTITSSDNSVPVRGDTVTLEVRQSSRDGVIVAIEKNIEAIVTAAKGLAKKLNDLADQIERRGGDRGQSLRAALVEPIRRRAETLRQLGIRLDSGGRMVVDVDQLREELRRDAAYVESRIGGSDGFASELADALFSARGDPGTRAPRALGAVTVDSFRVRVNTNPGAGVLLSVGA